MARLASKKNDSMFNSIQSACHKAAKQFNRTKYKDYLSSQY